jgi:ATP phosphoribosyltransferase regulatory subunit
MTPAAPTDAPEAAERLANLRALLARAGHRFVEPAVLQPVDMFVDLAGEDLRRRLFLTTAADGTELCLRPDYTIPVCRMHLAEGPAERPARYAYLGPVFRQRSAGPSEFLQAGAELLGQADREAADADALALALEAAAILGTEAPAVRIGDEALFAALLEAVALPEAWRRRLLGLFGDTPRLMAALDRLDGTAAAEAPTAASALADADPATARALVEDMLAIAGLAPVGGRGAGEIADRLIEQAALAAGTRLAPEPARLVKRYLAIEGPAEEAAAAIAAFAAEAGLDLAKPLQAFRWRLQLLETRGVDAAGLRFEAAFGRQLDYYTGFMFEMHDRARPGGQIVGGGRYDRLLALLGAPAPVPAVGFSIWLDRLGIGGGA